MRTDRKAGGFLPSRTSTNTMTKRYRQTRLLIEIRLLMRRFGEVDYEERFFSWLVVRRFPLPRGFRPRNTNLLLWIPELYPLIPPCSFAVSSELKKEGVDITSLNNLKPYEFFGWAYFQLPLQSNSWRPRYNISSNDNLLTLMNQIYEFLDNL